MNAIILDIDGTLLDSESVDERLYRQAVQTVLGPVRLREGWSAYTHVTDSGILREVCEDNKISFSSDLESRVKQTFVQSIHEHISKQGPFPEIEGAHQFVNNLIRSEAHVCAYATGGWGASSKAKLESAGFNTKEVRVFSSDDGVKRIDIMRAALSSLGANIKSVTYYGDGHWDVRACQELGWTFRPVGPKLGGISHFNNEASNL